MKVIFVAAALALAACGAQATAPTATPTATATPTTSPTPSPTPDIAAVGKQFLALIQTLTGPFDELNNYLIADKGVPFAEIQKRTLAYAQVLRTFDSAVLRLAWPASAMADVRTFILADGDFEGNLSNIVNASSYSSWLSQGEADVDKARAAAAILRADVGLPPHTPHTTVY